MRRRARREQGQDARMCPVAFGVSQRLLENLQCSRLQCMNLLHPRTTSFRFLRTEHMRRREPSSRLFTSSRRPGHS